jgi:hypothetical protein
MLGTNTSAGQVSNGLAHLTRKLQAARSAKRAMDLALNVGGFG